MSLNFGGVLVSTVDVGRRVGARLVSMLLVGILYAILYGIPIVAYGSGGSQASVENALFASVAVGGVYSLVLIVWQLIAFFGKSTSIGGLFLKFHWIKADTGEPAKGLVFLKYLVQGLFEGATLGLGAISYFVSYRDGQHWLDRAFNVVGINSNSLRQESKPQARAAAPAQAAPRVMPVQMPQRPASASSAPRPFSASPAATQPFMSQPPPASQPQPMRPTAAAAAPVTPPVSAVNPWALPTQDEPVWTPDVSSPAPSFPSFAPVGQPPLSPVAQPSPVTATPAQSSLLHDETVIDADLVDDQHPLVVFDDGQEQRLEGPVVIGRNPSAPEGYPFARVVQIVDESMKLSKTHVVLLPQDGAVAIFDVGATNGVHLEVDGARHRLSAREVHTIQPGSVVHFGGRFLRVPQ